MLRSLDFAALQQEFRSAKPFPHIVLDDFLAPERAAAVRDAFPAHAAAAAVGDSFETEFEHLKVQVTKRDLFPPPIRELHEFLASAEFLADLSKLTGIPRLLADPELHGGGIHTTDSGGKLDVHIDFNYVPSHGWWRRLNLLIFLNDDWQEDWGGLLELWDPEVERCEKALVPTMNRCAIFETSQTSWHGVTAVTSPSGIARKSISAYYYTRVPPPDFDDDFHGTVFRKRPSERG